MLTKKFNSRCIFFFFPELEKCGQPDVQSLRHAVQRGEREQAGLAEQPDAADLASNDRHSRDDVRLLGGRVGAHPVRRGSDSADAGCRHRLSHYVCLHKVRVVWLK